jgi:hypothetical protein
LVQRQDSDKATSLKCLHCSISLTALGGTGGTVGGGLGRAHLASRRAGVGSKLVGRAHRAGGVHAASREETGPDEQI